MTYTHITITASLLWFFSTLAPLAVAQKNNPHVVLETSLGKIEIELFQNKAPITVKNFLRYVKEKHYNGTIFHRVIPNFVIQAGGYTKDFKEKPTHKPIQNEADNGLKNKRGTVAMARTMVVHSATAQFYINLKDNPFLDHKNKTPNGWGYAVFGKVVKGMDVVDKIAQVKTTNHGPHQNVPIQPIIIQKAYLINKTQAAE